MLIYGSAMFLSAFLLFLVQPLIGKQILPWFGGAPSVWTTCLLFFQALLLAGYAYAHVLATRWPLRRQVVVHLSLVLATVLAVLWFSITPSPAWKPQGDQSPVLRILGLLALTIGAPFFLLSATAPLLQSWFSRTRAERFPYRLYAVSNLGSLLAILSYPFWIEPSMTLNRQAMLWGAGFTAFAALCVLLAQGVLSAGESAPPPDEAVDGPVEKSSGLQPWLWVGLTTCSSIMLLATTSMLSQDLAVVPLLWILPLGLYLLSFVICFQHERLYWRPLFVGGLLASVTWTVLVMSGSAFAPLRWQILSFSLTLFFACMVCHGELVRLRPGANRLTSFYLMVALGGTLGGVLVTVVAPRVFPGFWEYQFGLLATTLMILVVLVRDTRAGARQRGRLAAAVSGGLGVLWLVLAFVLVKSIGASVQWTVESARNFFGVLRVEELYTSDPALHQFSLTHGRIEHGFQFVDPQKHRWPVSYYGPDAGMGLAILQHPNRGLGQSMRIGVIGLGAGTTAAYGRPGDFIRFYEINPDVVRLSDKYFSYRRDGAAGSDVVLGDARISLERARDQGTSEQFDVLVVDAFSSDAIPVHLLTREMFEIYRYHLKPDGILAFHITSRYFDLSPVVRNLAAPGAGTPMHALWFHDLGNPMQWTDRTDWVVLTGNRAFMARPEVQSRITPWKGPVSPNLAWTDDYSNLFSLIQERINERN